MMIDDVPNRIRQPAVAGTFYPAGQAELAATVDAMLARAPAPRHAPKAIIAPHAGYIYSGPIAASAYVRVGCARDVVERVVLLGPAHRVPLRGLAASSAEAFATPLGLVPVDRAAVERLLALPQVGVLDEAHRGEHSLEVHLPFLQRVLGRFTLVPLVVGHAAPESVDEVLAALWGGPETLIVISSDLSHYYDYATARRMDAATSRAIEALAPHDIGDDGACGRMPIRGLLQRARRLGLRATTIDLRNSGDTAGGKDQVVGYGAYVFEETGKAGLTEEEREAVLDAASESLAHGLREGRPPAVDAARYAPALRARRASFVTLKRGDNLRGCIGSVRPRRALVADVVHNAYAAAFDDGRFPPLRPAELDELFVGVSVLSPLEPLRVASEASLLEGLRPGEDGLLLEDGEHRGVFLPQVWDSLPEAPDFLRHLKAKAGLEPKHWSDSIKLFRFSTESFSGPVTVA